MAKYLIDTNTVSHYLTGLFSENGMSFMDKIINDIPNLSQITRIELLCWRSNPTTENYIKNFISDSNLLDISESVILKCIKIRRKYKIKTPDAIIAATALTHGYTLITDNERDFVNIKGLKVHNPHKM